MKQKIYLILILLFNFITSWGQAPAWEWARNSTGQSGARSFQTDVSGNSCIAGQFWSTSVSFDTIVLNNTNPGNNDIYLAKYDNLGNVLWAKNAGGNNYDENYGLAICANGDVYICGSFRSPVIHFGALTLTNPSGDDDLFLAKYSSSGNVLWARSASNTEFDRSYGVAADANGNAYITGYFAGSTIAFDSIVLSNTSVQDVDIFIAKYDPSGNVIWAINPPGSNDDLPLGIATDANGNIYITGGFSSPDLTFGSTILASASQWEDVFLAKYDSSGNALWAIRAGGTNPDQGLRIATDINGNSYLTGYFTSQYITFGSITLINAAPGYYDLFIVKFDPAGNVIWAKRGHGNDSEFAYGCTPDVNGNLYLSGIFGSDTLTFGSTNLVNSHPPFNDLFVVKLNSSGNVIWAKREGGYDNDDLMGSGIDGNGNLYIGGWFNSTTLAFGNTILSNTSGWAEAFIAKTGNPTGIAGEEDFFYTVHIFPNPVTDELNVNVNSDEVSEIILYDLSSRKLLQQKFTGFVSISTDQLYPGIYFVKVRTGEKSYCRKIIVEKD